MLGVSFMKGTAGASSLLLGAKAKKFIHLIIINENRKELNVIIKPETFGQTEEELSSFSLPWLAFKVPECPIDKNSIQVEFKIPAAKIGNFDYFSVTGETNSLTRVGTCIRLPLGPCYKILFINNTFGTDCISTSLSDCKEFSQNTVQITDYQRVTATNIPSEPLYFIRPSEVLPRDSSPSTK